MNCPVCGSRICAHTWDQMRAAMRLRQRKQAERDAKDLSDEMYEAVYGHPRHPQKGAFGYSTTP